MLLILETLRYIVVAEGFINYKFLMWGITQHTKVGNSQYLVIICIMIQS